MTITKLIRLAQARDWDGLEAAVAQVPEDRLHDLRLTAESYRNRDEDFADGPHVEVAHEITKRLDAITAKADAAYWDPHNWVKDMHLDREQWALLELDPKRWKDHPHKVEY